VAAGLIAESDQSVVLFHATSTEAARAILETGELKADEFGAIYLSTSREIAEVHASGRLEIDALVEVRVPVSDLEVSRDWGSEHGERVDVILLCAPHALRSAEVIGIEMAVEETPESVSSAQVEGEQDALHARWVEWLEPIDGDITSLWTNRFIWNTVRDVVQGNPAIPASHFFDAYGDWYARAQAVGIRRQADARQDVLTLAVLIGDIAEHPDVLTRARFQSHYPQDWLPQATASRDFDTLAGEGADYFPAEVARADLEQLGETATPIRRYVNKVIAHYAQKQPAELPTYDDLNAAIDLLGELLRKYTLLLQAADRAEITPVFQYDWLAPFRLTWIPEHDD
jgi:hypothetical protein